MKIKGSVWVGLFLALFILVLCSESQAETTIEIGPSNVGYRWTDSATIMIQEVWQDKYALGLGYISPQNLNTCGRPDCKWEIQEQIMVGAERIVRYKRLSLSIGPYWFQNPSRISSSNFNVRLTLGVDITDRLYVKLSHFSNAGSGRKRCFLNNFWKNDRDGVDKEWLCGNYNMGQDAILVGWRFN